MNALSESSLLGMPVIKIKSTLSPEIKAQLIADIEKGDEAALKGMRDTLEICLGNSDNPNLLSVEYTVSQLDYVENWSANTGLAIPTILRGLVDIMMYHKPELGRIGTKLEVVEKGD
jgi:hypothetical protein